MKAARLQGTPSSGSHLGLGNLHAGRSDLNNQLRHQHPPGHGIATMTPTKALDATIWRILAVSRRCRECSGCWNSRSRWTGGAAFATMVLPINLNSGGARVTSDRHEEFRDVPSPPTGRGYWLGVLALLIIGTVGVGGQAIGLRAIDALSKAEIRLAAIQEEEQVLLLRIPTLRAERDQAIREHDAAQERRQTMKASLDVLDEDIRNAESTRATLREEAAKMTAASEAAEALQTRTSKLKAEEEALSKKLAELNAQEALLAEARAKNAEVFESRLKDQESVRASIRDLEATRTELAAEIQSREQELRRLERQIADRDTDRREWEARTAKLAALRSDEGDLERQVAKLQGEADALQSRITNAEQESMRAQGNAEDAERELAKTRLELDEAKEQLTSRRSQIDQYRDQERQLREAISRLERLQLDAEERTKKAREELDRVREDVRDRQDAATTQSTKIEQVQSAILENLNETAKRLSVLLSRLQLPSETPETTTTDGGDA